LEGQEGMDIANKERERQRRTNMATKERGKKNKKKRRGWTCHITKTHKIPNRVLLD